MAKKITLCTFLFSIVILTVPSCISYTFRNNYTDYNSFIHGTEELDTRPYLKAHLKNGDICILKDSWQLIPNTNDIKGEGTKYDFNRNLKEEGTFYVPIDSIVIFETNVKLQNPEAGRIAALAILSGIDVAIGIYCLTNPKACFGSCPTFYMNNHNNVHFADAEGFSNAISPSMEYYDIDALNNIPSIQDSFSIVMKNEALETHCVREVRLLAYPRSFGERVFQTPANEFYLCNNIYPVTTATADEGDITQLLKDLDHQERFSLSDEQNLSSKEEILLTFDKVKNSSDLGIVLNFRQTLMTTYFIYSAMGYMGDQISDIFAKVETNKEIKNKLKGGIKKELGNIDIYLWNEQIKEWELQDGFYETGPIATNSQLIPLKVTQNNKKIKIKLVLNKGLWRIDYAALTNLTKSVTPIEILPDHILNKDLPDESALADLLDPQKHLISMPGSEFKLYFELPESHTDYELFLYSKGYYLEWMRKHWLKDKDLLKLRQMINQPKNYLQQEAGNYKKYELTMEQEFWNSRIDTKNFSYYEN